MKNAMKDAIAHFSGISKQYRHNTALQKMDLTIRRGEIYGMIGENGAGKSTLIRIVTGLTRPSTGTLELFGETVPGKANAQRARIGYVPDTCALYTNMSALENLEIRRREWGIPGKDCIPDLLMQVGLKNAGEKKVRQYSLGMKQRLSLAIALLGDPELLILDEPTNGLDPTGIIELREILKKLNQQKQTTILVSSHILSELHQMATQYVIMSHGKLLECISAKELDAKCKRHLLLRVTDLPKTAILLENELHTENFEVSPGGIIRLYDYLEQPDKVAELLNNNGVGIKQISEQGDDLETYYTRLIGAQIG